MDIIGLRVRCPQCGFEGRARRRNRGSLLIEVILWLCMILPGLLYSIWSRSRKALVCPNCAYPYVVRL